MEQELNPTERKKQIIKLHKQFGHASAHNLKKLMANAGMMDNQTDKLIDNVVGECDTCIKYKKPAARPVVGLSKANDFNQTVSMDLHSLDQNLWYMHVIDEFTRFAMHRSFETKTPQSVYL